MSVLLNKEIPLQQFKSAYIEASGAVCKATFQKVPALFDCLGLRTPAEMHRDTFYDISCCVCEGTVLTPQACSRLREQAITYRSEIERVFQSLSIADCLQSVREDLRKLGNTHQDFTRVYADEFYKFNQAQEAYVSFPNTCQLFLDVFLNDYDHLSTSITEDEYFWIRLPSLAIERLLMRGEMRAPEIFSSQGDRIYKMSASYRDLSISEKQNLHQKLLGHEVELLPCTQELFKSIYLCQDQLNLRSLTGPQHFLYIESEKAENLFSHVRGQIETREDATRAIIRWFLDHPQVELKHLPLPFQKGQIIDELLEMKETGDESGLDAMVTEFRDNLELRPWLDALIR